MRKALVITLAGIASLAAFSSPASARDGCGDGWHRNFNGDCRPNNYHSRYYSSRFYGDRYAYPDADVDFEIGTFYPGRGYWDGDRFYMHRRWDGGWRYW